MHDLHAMQDLINQFFAKNEALYGGFVMELEEGASEEGQPTGEGEEQDEDKTPEGESNEEESGEGESGEGEQESEELPDWAREKLTKANSEAATYRTRLREIEQKLEAMTPTDEVEVMRNELTAEREASERALLIENVALKFGLPEQLASRLQGQTREEMEADAKSLAEIVGSKEVDLEGGLNPRDQDDDPDDPRSLAAKYGKRRNR